MEYFLKDFSYAKDENNKRFYVKTECGGQPLAIEILTTDCCVFSTEPFGKTQKLDTKVKCLSNGKIFYTQRRFITPLKEPEWKVIKPFTILDIYKADPCRSEFEELLQENWQLNVIFDSWTLISRSSTLIGNLLWLEKKGFIEKVETFEPFDLTLEIKDKHQLNFLNKVLNNKSAKGKETYFLKFGEIVDKEMWRIKE